LQRAEIDECHAGNELACIIMLDPDQPAFGGAGFLADRILCRVCSKAGAIQQVAIEDAITCLNGCVSLVNVLPVAPISITM